MTRDYPRVTNILQATKSEKDKQKLLEWQRKNTVRGEVARNTGTNFHNAIYDYLTTSINPNFEDTLESKRWNNALSELNLIKNDYLCVETEVWSDKYKYKGRLDCLSWEDNDLILVDWKTSSWLKKKEYIEDYYLQGTAYSLAAYECGVAPKMPSEIRIYLFTPQKIQIFKKPLGFDLVLNWLKRIELFNQLMLTQKIS